MNLDTQLFAGGYPTAPSTQAIRDAVAAQVEGLNRVGDPAGRREIVARLIEERAEDPVLDQLQTTEDVLHVRGEVLVDRSAMSNQAVRDAIARNSLAEAEVGKPLGDRIALFRNLDRKSTDLREMVRTLRGQKQQVALNYVVSNAAVGKSGDTPELAFSPGRYEDYPVPKLTGGVPVGVIDTGISAEVRGDGWLAGVNAHPSEIDKLDALPPPGFLDRAAGHGTHVAGIVQQVAPGATIRVLQALATDGLGSDVAVANAMLRAVDNGCRILNLSLGCSPAAGDPPPIAMRVALDLILARYPDVLVVAAAGNEGNDTKVYPAAWTDQYPDTVVAVAGLTKTLQPAGWSSHGPWVTASAVAEGIRSTFVEGREPAAIDPVPEVFSKSAWAVWGGTSFAAPQIAGAVARICQAQNVTPREAWAMLRVTGTAIAGYGRAFKFLPGVA